MPFYGSIAHFLVAAVVCIIMYVIRCLCYTSCGTLAGTRNSSMGHNYKRMPNHVINLKNRNIYSVVLCFLLMSGFNKVL